MTKTYPTEHHTDNIIDTLPVSGLGLCPQPAEMQSPEAGSFPLYGDRRLVAKEAKMNKRKQSSDKVEYHASPSH